MYLPIADKTKMFVQFTLVKSPQETEIQNLRHTKEMLQHNDRKQQIFACCLIVNHSLIISIFSLSLSPIYVSPPLVDAVECSSLR